MPRQTRASTRAAARAAPRGYSSRGMKLGRAGRKIVESQRRVIAQKFIASKLDQMGPHCFLAGTGKGKYYFCKMKDGECPSGKKSKSKYWPKRNRCALTVAEYAKH